MELNLERGLLQLEFPQVLPKCSSGWQALLVEPAPCPVYVQESLKADGTGHIVKLQIVGSGASATGGAVVAKSLF